MSDLVKAKETIKNISTCTSLNECQQVIQEICNESANMRNVIAHSSHFLIKSWTLDLIYVEEM